VREHPERSATSTVKIAIRPISRPSTLTARQPILPLAVTIPIAQPKKDFKLDDVMGGLVIEIPLGK